MNRIRMAAAAAAMVAVSVGLTLVAPGDAVAQGATQAASVPTGASTPTPRQVRKAARKAARAKRNAELSTLEKNGYHPSGDKTNYPGNLQNAQRKADMDKAAAGASSPGQ